MPSLHPHCKKWYLICDNTGRATEATIPWRPSSAPLGNDVEIDAVWQTKNRDGDRYYSVLINTGHSCINANLGRMVGQDDNDLYAIILRE